MAEALAKGIVVRDENGRMRSTDDAALRELGLSTTALAGFSLMTDEAAKALKEYGQTIAAADAQQQVMYQSLASQALQSVDAASVTQDNMA
jgi:hypothetical protein